MDEGEKIDGLFRLSIAELKQQRRGSTAISRKTGLTVFITHKTYELKKNEKSEDRKEQHGLKSLKSTLDKEWEFLPGYVREKYKEIASILNCISDFMGTGQKSKIGYIGVPVLQ